MVVLASARVQSINQSVAHWRSSTGQTQPDNRQEGTQGDTSIGVFGDRSPFSAAPIHTLFVARQRPTPFGVSPSARGAFARAPCGTGCRNNRPEIHHEVILCTAHPTDPPQGIVTAHLSRRLHTTASSNATLSHRMCAPLSFPRPSQTKNERRSSSKQKNAVRHVALN